eukprot:333336-Pyramimonas_sp.AAC.1
MGVCAGRRSVLSATMGATFAGAKFATMAMMSPPTKAAIATGRISMATGRGALATGRMVGTASETHRPTRRVQWINRPTGQ